MTCRPCEPQRRASVGFVGESDAASDAEDGMLSDAYRSTGGSGGMSASAARWASCLSVKPWATTSCWASAMRGPKAVGGWFLQKTQVDGQLAWVAVQGDQTAMPIMLGWKLCRHGVLDGGFLELVRYGVRSPDSLYVLDTLEELDDTTLAHPLCVKYEFRFPGDPNTYAGWRRYGLDGYGEDRLSGANYGATGAGGGMSPAQRGRVWPFFTGERAHYELARGESLKRIRQHYVRGLQVWDHYPDVAERYQTALD